MDIKPVLIIAALVLIFILEGVFPFYKDRTQRGSHALPHLLTALINGLLTRFLLAGLTMHAIAWAQDHHLGIMRIAGLPSFVSSVIVLILFDVWMYYWHMLNHRAGFLWRFHRAHHSDIAMDTTTALRFHPGELILSTIFRLPVVVLIGVSLGELLLFEVLMNISTLFHHSNLALPEKWDRMLRAIIVTPHMHRVHHSVERNETNSNYTSLLSLWDRIGGTFRTRQDTTTISLGLPSFRDERSQRLWGFLLTPFK